VLFTHSFVAVETFRRELVAADGAFVFFRDLTSLAMWLRMSHNTWRTAWECRSRKHVDNRLRSRTEIEGKLAIVGGSVARCR
jgi:hypothetical protein